MLNKREIIVGLLIPTSAEQASYAILEMGLRLDALLLVSTFSAARLPSSEDSRILYVPKQTPFFGQTSS